MQTTVNPPFDLIAERSTLGALLVEREAVVAVAPFLRSEHFYLERHGLIYAAQLACYERREPPDLAMVAAELRRRGQLEQIGGVAALNELAMEVPTAVHIEYYARIVERAWAGRALMEVGGHIMGLGYDDSRPIEERLDEAAERIHRLAAGRHSGLGFVPLSQVASECLDALYETADEGDLLGLGTGYPELDAITQGIKPGEMVVLAARPGMGKTALALCIAHHVAQRGEAVAIFSMEMDRGLLLQRLVAIELGIETVQVPRMLRQGNQVAINALARVASLPIYIDHSPGQGVQAIRDRARQLAGRHKIALWIVDYLQLAQGISERDDDFRRISTVSQGLTSMARELRAPVLALSQLSRAVEARAGHVPMLSDLRGSGSIEQDASQVWFIYRDEMYNRESDCRGLAEIHVSKHRNGATGVAVLRFDPPTARFLNVDRVPVPRHL